MTRATLGAGLGLLLLGTGCEQPTIPDDPPFPAAIDAQLRQELSRWNVLPIAPMPAQDPALVALGRALTFDNILSGNRDVSCATCHNPLQHMTDGLSLSIGTGGTGLGPSRTLGPGREFVPRNSPTLLNQGLRAEYVFWDGRVSGFGSGPFTSPAGVKLPARLPNILAAQAMLPVLNRREMRGKAGDVDVFGNVNELAQFADSQYVQVWQAIMARLLAIPEYVEKFNAAFPTVPTQLLEFRHAATAIAAFLMQELTKDDSPFDRYLNHEDAALPVEAKRGALLFFGVQGTSCASCHNGPLLGGQTFANDGAPQLGPGTGSRAPLDFGRGDVTQPNLPGPPSAPFAFRVPPLRNVELTAPYFHDGVYPTLEAVLRHYNDVRTALLNYDVSQVGPALQAMYHGDAATVTDVLSSLDFRVSAPRGLTDQQRSDLVAFLKSLTDPAARDLSGLIPASAPSGLPVR